MRDLIQPNYTCLASTTAGPARSPSMSRSSADDANLKIGAVARLTGLSVHTLRKWEDRYGAVEPRRTEGGERVYSRTDLKRLAYIKQLAEAGMALREIARLPLEALEEAREQMGGTGAAAIGADVPERVRVIVLGDVLPALIERRDPALGRLNVVASADSERALRGKLGDESADVLVYECPGVRKETREEIAQLLEHLPVRGVIVVYGFGARRHLAALRGPNVASMRAPVDVEELEQMARSLVFGVAASRAGMPDTRVSISEEGVPEPRLTRETIARIATTVPRMRCECPHHLADIVLSLRAFEEYSKTCESLNEEDADLHHYLWLSAGRARALFEDAIVRVAEAEGISLKQE